MFSDNSILLFLTLCSISVEVQSLVKLPTEGNNGTPYTEAVIRDTINNIFTNFGLSNVRTKPRLQEYNIVHNFFVTMTLKNFNNLKKIERLSRVYDLNNGSNFIPEINEVLNAKDERDVLTDNYNVTVYTAEAFINKLRHLKEIHKLQNTMGVSDINPEILNQILNKRSIINYSNETILGDNLFRVPKVDRRLYHGHEGDIRNMPFMASIHIFDVFHCAGSIIKNDVVLTSATCLKPVHDEQAMFRRTFPFLSVRVGSVHVDRGGQVHSVKDMHTHPHFNPNTLWHNIAFLTLSHKLKLFGLVNRIVFDTSPEPFSDHSAKILVAGWGVKTKTDDRLHKLSYAVLDVHPRECCQKMFSKKRLSKHHFCGSVMPLKGGACKHDMGGPGIIKGKLFGVISFASEICGNSPTVFTKVGFYAKWMKRVLNKDAEDIIDSQEDNRPTTRKESDLGDDLLDEISHPGNDSYLDLFKSFVSGLFLRAQDDTASMEDVTKGTDVINILD